MRKFLLKSIFIPFLLILYNCEKIPAVQNGTQLSLAFTCESCHTNEVLLKQLASEDEPSGGGGG